MKNGIPNGWKSCTMADITALVTSGSRDWSKFYSDHGAFFVRSAEINDFTLRLSEAIHVSLPDEIEGKRSLIEKGDILITITGANVGKCAKVDDSIPEAYVSQSVALVKPICKETTPFVYYALRSPNFGQKQLLDMAYGVGRPVLSLPNIRSLEVPLAPFNEQRRIVAKLEKLLSKVDACQKRLEKIPVILKRFRQSVLAAACSGRLTEDWRDKQTSKNAAALLAEFREKRLSGSRTLTERAKVKAHFQHHETNNSEELPDTWQFTALRKLCRSFDYGTSAKSHPSGRMPVLRMGNIQNGKIDWSNLAYTSDQKEISKYSLEPQTVLFNRTNSPELVGKTAIYRGERPAIFAGYLIRINPYDVLHPEYLNYCLNSNYAKDFCLSVKTDGVSQSNINAQKLSDFEIPFCSAEEQQEIVRRVEALFSFADQIEARYQKAKAHVDNLTQSILAKAFRGELVQPDPNDEPASVLLERIREEREGQKKIAAR